MAGSVKSVEPVAPHKMDLVFAYQCPYCQHDSMLYTPTQPGLVRCEACDTPFPIMPVDERSVRYIKIMMANGRAAVDPDFL